MVHLGYVFFSALCVHSKVLLPFVHKQWPMRAMFFALVL